MTKFVLILKYSDDIERRLSTRPVHRQYLADLQAAGKLHESGPFIDDSGALIIYEVADRAEAEATLAADPFTKAGGIIENVTIHEWNQVFPN